MAKLNLSLAALSVLAAVSTVAACDGGKSGADATQSTDAPTPGGAKAATYSPAEICFSNEAFDELTKSFPEQPEDAAPAAAGTPPSGAAEAAEKDAKVEPEDAAAAAAASKKEAADVLVPANAAAPKAAPADGEDATEFDGLKILKGRKDYCCHSPTGGQKPIRASHTASAILKCKKHAPLGWVSKGPC